MRKSKTISGMPTGKPSRNAVPRTHSNVLLPVESRHLEHHNRVRLVTDQNSKPEMGPLPCFQATDGS